MKKVSTAATKQIRNFSQTKLAIGFADNPPATRSDVSIYSPQNRVPPGA